MKLNILFYSLFYCVTSIYSQITSTNDELKKSFYRTLTTYPDSSQLILKQFVGIPQAIENERKIRFCLQ